MRYLPEFDNVALSHADRSHLAADTAIRWPTSTATAIGRPRWSTASSRRSITRERRSATPLSRPRSPSPRPDRSAVEEEAARLLAFLTPDAEQRQVQLTG